MSRRVVWLALLGMALSFALPADAQIRRPGQRGAKKGIVERPQRAQRQGATAEDFVMRLVQQPKERRRTLLENNARFKRLPAVQRKRILARIEQIDAMPAEERARLVERYNLFSRLDPEKREQARGLYAEWTRQTAARRRMMTGAVRRLRGMNAAERAKALESEAFTSRFDERERALIGEIVELAPGPAR